jgi:hypothetical protein
LNTFKNVRPLRRYDSKFIVQNDSYQSTF